ncbi:hypothetical protein [Laceyella sacchari]|jgi:hypothetical protein|uniref:DUF3784 domain-containing protein n=1 Tax=Laceyella sacchari TaxID=37482 RepID=A0ABY5U6L0_LACSH|nr:hypothetical protein [Laceyella sacchari]UWE05292.1 hypothetical protein NYR52_16595 [Laceyella sacchari]
MIETSLKWACLTLVGTTCAVLIYLVIVLASIIRGDRHVKSVLNIGSEEYVFESKQGKELRFKHHKLFWLGVGAAYAVGVTLMFWYIILIPIVLALVGKVFGKVGFRKA